MYDASTNCHSKVVEYLISKNADVNFIGNKIIKHLTPL
ncbi:hypothetical protein [Brachyspira hampsonii]